MKKGYFFTVDALIAIILIIIFSSFMVISHPATDNSKVFENYKQHTTDASFVGYYKGLMTDLDIDDIHGEFVDHGVVSGTTYDAMSTAQGYCAYHFDYDVGTGVSDTIRYCKGGN